MQNHFPLTNYFGRGVVTHVEFFVISYLLMRDKCTFVSIDVLGSTHVSPPISTATNKVHLCHRCHKVFLGKISLSISFITLSMAALFCIMTLSPTNKTFYFLFFLFLSLRGFRFWCLFGFGIMFSVLFLYSEVDNQILYFYLLLFMFQGYPKVILWRWGFVDSAGNYKLFGYEPLVWTSWIIFQKSLTCVIIDFPSSIWKFKNICTTIFLVPTSSVANSFSNATHNSFVVLYFANTLYKDLSRWLRISFLQTMSSYFLWSLW